MKKTCNKLISKAYEYLKDKEISHMDLLEAIRRGTAEIIFAEEDGLLILEKIAELYIISAKSKNIADMIIDKLENPKLVSVHQEFFIDLLNKKFNLKHIMTCNQGVLIDFKPQDKLSNIKFGWLNTDYEKEVTKLYSHDIGDGYIYNRLEENEILGAFKDSELIGFIGLHEEGSMGMLEVKSDYRNKGIASQLVYKLSEYQISKDRIPFSQFEIDNFPSRKLHEKLGFKISNDLIYWLEK